MSSSCFCAPRGRLHDPVYLPCRLHRARVMLTHSQDSWVSIPSQLAGQLLATDAAMPVILRVRQLSALGAPAGRPLHLAWAGDVAAAAGVLEVPSALGRALGLLSGSQVVLEPLPEGAVAAAEMVVVEPVGPSDWEVVELNAGLLEDRLLTQVSASFSGWKFDHVYSSKVSPHTEACAGQLQCLGRIAHCGYSGCSGHRRQLPAWCISVLHEPHCYIHNTLPLNVSVPPSPQIYTTGRCSLVQPPWQLLSF